MIMVGVEDSRPGDFQILSEGATRPAVDQFALPAPRRASGLGDDFELEGHG